MSNLKRIVSLFLLAMMFVSSAVPVARACLPSDSAMGASPSINVVDELPAAADCALTCAAPAPSPSLNSWSSSRS